MLRFRVYDCEEKRLVTDEAFISGRTGELMFDCEGKEMVKPADPSRFKIVWDGKPSLGKIVQVLEDHADDCYFAVLEQIVEGGYLVSINSDTIFAEKIRTLTTEEMFGRE